MGGKGAIRGQGCVRRRDEPIAPGPVGEKPPLRPNEAAHTSDATSSDTDVMAEIAIDDETSVTGRYRVIRDELAAAHVYHLSLGVRGSILDAQGIETGEFPAYSLYQGVLADDGVCDEASAGARDEAADPPANPVRRIRVLLVNPEPLVLRGLSSLLADEPEIEVVGHATRGDQALAQVAQHVPDVVILAPELPDISGLALVEKLLASQSKVRPVMLASQISDKQFIQARQSGVRGVLLTTMPVRLIVQCVKTVHAGEEFLEKETLIKALTLLIRRQNEQGPAHDALTEREREVADLAAAGLSNTEIARRLNVGSGTVKSHLHSVYDKLGVHSRYALMRFAAAKKT